MTAADADVEVEVPCEDEDVDIEVELQDVAADNGQGAPAEEEEAHEPECDDEHDASVGCIKHEVALSTSESTPNVFFSAGGVVSAVTTGSLRNLLSAVRCDTGAKVGRYLFEVQVLDETPGTRQYLRVGFGTAGSSLFLGETPDGVAFDRDGTYLVSEPGQLADLKKSQAVTAFGSVGSVIGVLLNLDEHSTVANTVSLFVDGVRVGPPQPVPGHLRGRALFPAVTFRGATLAVNLGRGGAQLRALPFKCAMLGQVAEEHHETLSVGSLKTSTTPEVLLPVGLPGQGLADITRKYREEHPNVVEVSTEMFADWRSRSGLTSDGVANLAWENALVALAVQGGRSVLVSSGCRNLLTGGRQDILKRFPASYRRVALVAVGEPSELHTQWVRQTVEREYEEKKALVEKRLSLAEAAGDALEGDDAQMPDPPVLDETLQFLPRAGGQAPEVPAADLAASYANFSLPSDEEFASVDWQWSTKLDAQEHLRQWVVKKKASLLVEGLRPGQWFSDQQAAWKKERKRLREGHLEYNNSRTSTGGAEVDLRDDPARVKDIHNADGDGTPLYANFRYEDWVLLSWRYELHLLVHSFAADVGDADIPGITPEHVAHYYGVYFGTKCDWQAKLGVPDVRKALDLLREPLTLGDSALGQEVLQSQLEADATLDDFVKGVEAYRRDRKRRLDAGDESVLLSFPRPTAAKKAAEPVAPASVPAGFKGEGKAGKNTKGKGKDQMKGKSKDMAKGKGKTVIGGKPGVVAGKGKAKGGKSAGGSAAEEQPWKKAKVAEEW